jgi:branched-chain amino acid transport system permease protein
VFELGGGLIIAQQRALILVVAAIVIGAVYLFIRRTAMGKMMQATAQNPVGAALSGIDIRWVHSYTFGIACGLAALGGGLVGPTSSLSPSIGIWAVIKGFIVVIMGGMGNVPGALAAGIFLGVAESLGAGYVSAGFGQAIGYTLVVLIILLRPASLFAKGR